MKKTFCVAIPTHNRKDYLNQAVSSVLGQTRQADEIIIVDNGENPLPSEEFGKDVRVVRIEPNAGAAKARNAAAKLSCSKYIAFLDDDDFWSPEYLAEVEAICDAQPKAGYIIARIDKYQDGQVSPLHEVSSLGAIRKKIWTGNPGTVGSNVIVDRTTFLELGGYNETLVASEDRALTAEFLKNGVELAFAQKARAFMRVHGGERLSNHGTSARGRERFLELYVTNMTKKEVYKNRAIINWYLYNADKRPSNAVKTLFWSARAFLQFRN